jgi:5-methylcytosine-specific restriction endonuclease McrA
VRENVRKKKTGKSVEEIVRELRQTAKPSGNYRELSLKKHGLICAKCGREFQSKDRHLLTVHHKDGNPRNNPPDGSNWENLCVYCHDDEHSRGLLSDYWRTGH